MRFEPLSLLRPAPGLASRVGAPPYDVVTRAEALALAAGEPLSFLRVARADIEFPADADPHSAAVHARARQSLERLIADGALVRAPRGLYVYREVVDGRSQVGVVGGVHLGDYEQGVIRKHEGTRRDKEEDRTEHILRLDAQAEPVLLAYRGRPEIDRLVGDAMKAAPLDDFAAADGVRHTVWALDEPERCVELFGGVPRAYVADGHHRTAAALGAARRLCASRPVPGDAPYDWLLAALVPADQLRILAYNRVVADLGGRTPGDVLDGLRAAGRLTADAAPIPSRPGTFSVYLAGRWHGLELGESSIDRRDPVASLDVALLHERVLGPVLGIGDERTDPRIDFVGARDGAAALAARVDAGRAALAISLHPTTVEQLMAVSDAGHMMPPKSTWFDPKLLSGLFAYPFAGG